MIWLVVEFINILIVCKDKKLDIGKGIELLKMVLIVGNGIYRW